MTELEQFLARAEKVLTQVESLLPSENGNAEWQDAVAYRWRKNWQRGHLQPLHKIQHLRLADLHCVDRQKHLIERNIKQFVSGLPANNIMLWGARGTGKSSLVKAVVGDYAPRGLRMVEVEKHDLVDLPDIVAPLADRPEKFLLYTDDLSFEADDPSYKALKAALDGSISATPANVLICATSNRRHLLPEYMSENLDTKIVGGELHHGEAVEEKISLSERFGLWLSFHPFSQDNYLEIVSHWLVQLGGSPMDEISRKECLAWSLTRGSRSGRVAWQFALDWVGRKGLSES